MIKRQVYILIGFAIILIAIPVTLYLVRQTQIFAPKAAFIPKVEFVDAAGKVITETTDPNVGLRITKEAVTISPSHSPTQFPSPSPMVSSTPTPTSSPSPIPTVCTAGDVNQDGEVNAADLQFVLNIAGGLVNPTAEQTKRADVNGDGQVNQVDVLLMRRYLNGLIKTFPVCEGATPSPAATLIQLPALDSGS